NFNKPDALKNYLKIKVIISYLMLLRYYKLFKTILIYYVFIFLYLYYKYYFINA
ncbi:hypothetical protein BU23DRAFT_455423, partial [Bimuria novae-zelandiae CBS 107.79]